MPAYNHDKHSKNCGIVVTRFEKSANWVILRFNGVVLKNTAIGIKTYSL